MDGKIRLLDYLLHFLQGIDALFVNFSIPAEDRFLVGCQLFNAEDIIVNFILRIILTFPKIAKIMLGVTLLIIKKLNSLPGIFGSGKIKYK